MSYTYTILSAEQIRLIDDYAPWANKVRLSELLDNALAVSAGEIPAGSIDGTKLAADAVSGADKIADNAVSIEHLDAAITPAFICINAVSTFTTVGGAAAEAVADANTLAGDIVVWSILDSGTGSVTGVSAVAGAGSITFTFSADP